jgi:hypothetical protein
MKFAGERARRIIWRSYELFPEFIYNCVPLTYGIPCLAQVPSLPTLHIFAHLAFSLKAGELLGRRRWPREEILLGKPQLRQNLGMCAPGKTVNKHTAVPTFPDVQAWQPVLMRRALRLPPARAATTGMYRPCKIGGVHLRGQGNGVKGAGRPVGSFAPTAASSTVCSGGIALIAPRRSCASFLARAFIILLRSAGPNVGAEQELWGAASAPFSGRRSSPCGVHLLLEEAWFARRLRFSWKVPFAALPDCWRCLTTKP